MAAAKKGRRSPGADGRPGRALAIILIALVALTGAMFISGDKTPRLGIDLAGGTEITLTARNTPGQANAINKANMNTAVDIINKRVNGLGVSEAEVQTQGDKNIIVDIPRGTNTEQAAKQVGTTAQLYFRPVIAETAGSPTPTQTPSPSASSSASPSGKPTASSSAKATSTGSAKPTASSTAQGRAVSDALKAAASGKPTAAASHPPTVAPSGTPAAPPTSPAQSVSPELQKQFAALDCSKTKQRAAAGMNAKPTEATIGCSQDGAAKYLLAPAAVAGKDVSSAKSVYDTQSGAGWIVTLGFNSKGNKQFATVTRQLAQQQSPNNQFAIVLDNQVVSSPSVSSAITGGQAQISGSFTQQSSADLANVLSYGALPLTFATSDITTVSPQLGGEQLHGGLVAGAVGLLLVVLYLLAYYRGLSFVAVVLPGGLGRADVHDHVAARRCHRVRAEPAGRLRCHRGHRYHRGLLHRLLRADPRRAAARPQPGPGRPARLAACPAHHPGLRLRVVPGRRRAVHLLGRQGAGLRVHPRSDHGARRGRGLPVHQAADDDPGPPAVLLERPPVVRARPQERGLRRPAAPGPPSGEHRNQGGLMSRLGNLGHRLHRGEVAYDFVGKRKLWYGVSILITLVAIAGLVVNGLNKGIEFSGGAVFTTPKTSVSASVAQTKAESVVTGHHDVVAQKLGTGGLRIQISGIDNTSADKVKNDLAGELGVSANDISPQVVGPSWGQEISQKAELGLVIFMVLVVIYLAIAFEWRMAVAALVALIHDLTITIGVYAIVGFEVTPGTVIGLLTILGYSLYDTVVVFDGLKETTKGITGQTRSTYSELANRCLEPDPGPVDQHHGRRAAAGRRAALRRWRTARRGHAQRHRARAVRRPGRRCVLLDLHRHPAGRLPQGGHPGDAGADQAGRVPARRRPRRRAPTRRTTRRAARRTAESGDVPAQAGAGTGSGGERRQPAARNRGRGRPSGKRR